MWSAVYDDGNMSIRHGRVSACVRMCVSSTLRTFLSVCLSVYRRHSCRPARSLLSGFRVASRRAMRVVRPHGTVRATHRVEWPASTGIGRAMTETDNTGARGRRLNDFDTAIKLPRGLQHCHTSSACIRHVRFNKKKQTILAPCCFRIL